MLVVVVVADIYRHFNSHQLPISATVFVMIYGFDVTFFQRFLDALASLKTMIKNQLIDVFEILSPIV